MPHIPNFERIEWIFITIALVVAIYLSTSGRLKALRLRYAYIVFLIVYPIFLYIFVLHDFAWIKLIAFLIMLASSLNEYSMHKARLAANEVQRPS